ncbi:DUF3413 domain-containing protein [Shewanella schlegeliana]|uniref:DUF3413 domain-containing protein n=1 Tax=Shewanella schlegeliana TaxID=190308 RepID=A0ABS1T2Y7_9GAMM|nr:DUF3413 domain-containing protein [Shewanella schlegeliana]MBL4915161.1 DUF3413 domain-containing protein [Shewanella schlegeliana]MCL1110971.1 DUF3413 domain-containing protein [Shewanella schlegeliana]GIU29382.1 sulfatase [Shewanella schlegeliana]
MVERQKQIGRDRVSRLVSWGHWFAFINGLLAIIVGYRYLDSIGLPETFIGWGYLVISTIGHFSFLAFMVYLVFIFPITLLLPYSRILRGYAAVVATLSLCLLLYDTVIYDDYGLHLSPFVFDLAWADLNALLRGTSYIITPIAILVIELTLANFLWKRIERIRKRNVGNKVVAIVGICFVSSHLIHIWGDAADVTEITHFDDAYPLSYPATAKSLMESYGIEGIQDHQSQTPPKSRLQYPLEPMQCHADSQPNILVIAVDSLRADLVNESTMPFLSSYAKHNVNFTQHLSGGNQFNSGMFSLLYGLQGSYSNDVDLHYQSPVLTQELASKGYELGLFTTQDTLASPLAIYKDFERIDAEHLNSYAKSDLQSIANWQQWTDSARQPWFSLLNLKSPDSYDTPIGFLGIKTVQSEAKLKPAQKVLFNQYRQSLNFIDKQIEQVVNSLPEGTMVVITGVNGKMFTSNPDEARVNLSPDSVRVPMIIHWPNEVSPKQVNYRTTHNGLVPAIMTQILGCTNPASDYSSDQSLMQPSDKSWVYVGDHRIFAIYQPSEITVIDRHGKYRIYDSEYRKRLKKKMSAPELIEVMREGRRLHTH